MARRRASQLRAAVREQRQEGERLQAERLRVCASGTNGSARADGLLDCERRMAESGTALEELSRHLAAAEATPVGEEEITAALQAFDPVWTSLRTVEQAAVIGTLIERIDYDGPRGRVAVRFRSAGLAVLGGADAP